MTDAMRFVLFNLLPSLVAGLGVLALVLVGIRIFRIRHGTLRACLLIAPIVKSTLVLVGLTVLS